MNPEFEEREVNGLTVRIDRTLCVGFGDCVTEAPKAFALDAEDIAVFVSPEDEQVILVKACDVCPVDALTVLDRNGSQLAP